MSRWIVGHSRPLICLPVALQCWTSSKQEHKAQFLAQQRMQLVALQSCECRLHLPCPMHDVSFLAASSTDPDECPHIAVIIERGNSGGEDSAKRSSLRLLYASCPNYSRFTNLFTAVTWTCRNKTWGQCPVYRIQML